MRTQLTICEHNHQMKFTIANAEEPIVANAVRSSLQCAETHAVSNMFLEYEEELGREPSQKYAKLNAFIKAYKGDTILIDTIPVRYLVRRN